MRTHIVLPHLLLTVLFCSSCLFLFAQPNCDTTPANCVANLKNDLYTVISKQSDISYSKNPLPTSFLDVSYADDDGNCVSVDDCLNDDAALEYDVYYPKNHNYIDCPLPAVILFHPGGFIECTNRNSGIIMETLSEEFARRGFVTFNVEYRRGRKKDEITTTNTTVQQELAVYRACQDARGAIRSIIRRQLNETSGDNWQDPYRIDIENTFIGGASAGGVMTMISVWYTNSMVYQAFPSLSASDNIQTVLGPINADYYYGDSTYNYKPKIKAVLNMWGGMYIPQPSVYDDNEPAFFSDNNATLRPLIAFHGKQDAVFPYEDNPIGLNGAQDVNFSPSPNTGFNTESACLRPNTGPFAVNRNSGTVDLISASSLNMYKIATSLGVPAELYADCDMDHGLDHPGPYFGTTLTATADVCRYIAFRTSVFFQAVMNNIADDLTTTLFEDCENKRVKCSLIDNITCRTCTPPSE